MKRLLPFCPFSRQASPKPLFCQAAGGHESARPSTSLPSGELRGHSLSSSHFGQPQLGHGLLTRSPTRECRSASVDTQRTSWLYSRIYLVYISPPRNSLRNICHGLVLRQTAPLAGGIVHLKDGVHQHGGASGPIVIRQDLRVLA